MNTAVVARFRNAVAASEFVGALGSLGVKPENVLPGALYAGSRGVRVALTSFVIELTSAPQVSQPNIGRLLGISFSNLSIRDARVSDLDK